MIMGYFNFRNINWETTSTHESENSVTYLYLEGIGDIYLYQHTFEPTRGRMSNEPHILDLILTSDEHDIMDIKNLSPLGKSYHSVLEFKLNCIPLSIEEVSISEKYDCFKRDHIGIKIT